MTDVPPAASPTLELNYFARSRRVPLWLRIILLVIGLPVAACPWLVFTWTASPWGVVRDLPRTLATRDFLGLSLQLLALPFFLGLLIPLWKIRLAVWNRSSPVERVVAWAVGVTSMLMTATVITLGFSGGGVSLPGMLILGGAAGGIALTVGLLAWLRHRRRRAEILVSALLNGAFLCNAGLCLILFSDSREEGWVATLMASVGLLAELLLYAMWSCETESR